ncbi:MAG: TetR/AcrR family transcriptional regulator [Deltaproteobacteria bacterium]|nr:TetR/AcrR family transcriptional regulator [Deltaproteobacteria bacterium]
MARMGEQALSVDGSVRRKLLAGAAELFTRKGYAATTVREIVAAAGVSKPVLYYYFKNKEGIYLELMRETFTKADGLLASTLEERGTVTKKLMRFFDQAFSLFLEKIQGVRVMYAIYYGPHQGAPFFDFDAYHLRIQQTIRRLVEQGIRQGEFRRGNAEDMTWAILGALNVAIEVHLGHPEMSLGCQGLARVLKVILQGIGARKGTEKGARK